MAYVAGASDAIPVATGCIFCTALAASPAHDREHLVLRRGERAYLILNRYPYTSGHLMAVVNRHVSSLAEATRDELADTMALTGDATRMLGRVYRPDGFNIGINQGRAAGAGIEGHLHVHVVPRWAGDCNFMPVLGEVRVLPEALEVTWARLREAPGD
ncbi:MAG: HIT domain-containing protein [Candidatus Rokubacteria bacterium]|nr:HIT domain-containing protein [Candidatus Rokubacteria bacterium]MBI3827727.1 HIT domain-containing protein [Candidatus Rokubacteria bacterium]